MLPREQWGVVIHDHHPGYISWEQFLRNEQRLAANNTSNGARPPREGSALLQGIVRCGGCGRSMTTCYSDGKPGYDCGHSRTDQVNTPGCRGVMGEVVEQAVAERLLAAVAPEQIALALTAADTVADRARARPAPSSCASSAPATTPPAPSAPFTSATPTTGSSRAASSRAGKPSCASSPTPRPSSPARPPQPAPPARADIEALARDLPRLWAAPSTSHRDRKRLLRALINDVTLTSQPDQPEIQVGIHWRSGASDELTVAATRRRPHARAQPPSRDLLRELGPTHTNAQLADHLNAAGHAHRQRPPVRRRRTCAGCAGAPHPQPGRRSPATASSASTSSRRRLDVADRRHLRLDPPRQAHARRGPGNRLRIRFTPDIEHACRQRVAQLLPPIKSKTKIRAAGGAV